MNNILNYYFKKMYDFDISKPRPQQPAYAQPPPPIYTSNLRTTKKEIVNEYVEEEMVGSNFKTIRKFRVTKSALNNEVIKNEYIYIMENPQGKTICIMNLRTGEYKEFYEFETFNGMKLKYEVKR